MRHERVGVRCKLRVWAVRYLPAELVDSLLARPLPMYLMPGLIHDLSAGIVVGKLAADVVFYGIAISAYELRQHDLALPGPAER